jgi:hypothetical protein
MLPDPRCYGAADSDDRLLRLASDVASGGGGEAELRARARMLLEAGDDDALFHALERAPGRGAFRAIWNAVGAVAEGPCTVDAEIVARPFAIPVVLVAGARRPLQVPGVLPDVGELHSLLEREGALGATRNFGLSAELAPLETLERLRPSAVFRWRAAVPDGPIDGMRGEPVEVAPGREQAYLRFVLGAGITPSHHPSLIETAGDIGRWGMPFTRTLARQLARDGLELLPLARPPATLLDAPQCGRRAALEVALHLFASHAIRACRMTAGEPAVVVSAHRGGHAAELRVSVSSLLDDALLEGFRWPLHPLDDLDEITAVIAGLLAACRVDDVRWLPRVLDRAVGGAGAYIPVRQFDRAAETQRSA